VVINLIIERGMSVLCVLMILMSLASLYYYTRVCYVILSQSRGINVITGVGGGIHWGEGFILVFMVLCLLAAPIFVTLV
jgi:NADH:ubiquinone oxidoreductase subunit 2 (subunit N)